MLNGLDLFSGIGGLALALDSWVQAVAYCENDRYAQSVLLNRMCEGSLSPAPIWDDIRTLHAEMLPSIDIIFGGFPCQDISVAGTGTGLEGSRSGLFFEIIRLCRDLRPRFIFLENVPAITIRGLDRVLLEFTSLGYDCRWTIVSAAEMGAPHLRERWFLLAHAHGKTGRIFEQQQKWNSETTAGADGGKKSVADSDREGLEVREQRETNEFTTPIRRGGWSTEPDVGRMAHGVPNRVDRLRGLGNAVVPIQAKEAFERLMGLSGVVMK